MNIHKSELTMSWCEIHCMFFNSWVPFMPWNRLKIEEFLLWIPHGNKLKAPSWHDPYVPRFFLWWNSKFHAPPNVTRYRSIVARFFQQLKLMKSSPKCAKLAHYIVILPLHIRDNFKLILPCKACNWLSKWYIMT